MESDFQSGLPTNILRGIVPTATLWDGTIGYAYLDDGGAFTDDTVDANSAGANDVPLMPAVPVLNDAFYFGEGFATSAPFNAIKINLGTAGVGGTIAWEYYDTDTTWKAIPGIVDATNGFTTAGAALYVTWTIPATMQHVAVNGQDRYWIRARVLTAFAPIPLATQIWLGKYPTSLANTTDGDNTTSSGVGTVTVSAAGYIGYLTYDLGTSKTVLVSSKVGAYSSTGIMYVVVDDNSSSTTMINNSPTLNYSLISQTTTEKIGDIHTRVFTSRYIRFQVWQSAAGTANMKFYTAKAYELGA